MEISQINNEIWSLLAQDIIDDPDNYPNKKPLLAHYTSIETLESILKSDEIWFSNPLFMNDFQEIRFGITLGHRLFTNSRSIKEACKSEASYQKLTLAFEHYFEMFSNKDALDTYAFCFSEHNLDHDKDGLLSMWRGYGGNGKGIAIIFDLGSIKENTDSPLIISKVSYCSNEEHEAHINKLINITAEFIQKGSVNDDQLYLIAYHLFERIKVTALFTKHNGFKEEREWRVAYFKSRDPENAYQDQFGHLITNRGVEPKLKLNLSKVNKLTKNDLSLEKLIAQIILGPMVSDKLASESIRRLFDIHKKSSLGDKVVSSTIPYRSL